MSKLHPAENRKKTINSSDSHRYKKVKLFMLCQ